MAQIIISYSVYACYAGPCDTIDPIATIRVSVEACCNPIGYGGVGALFYREADQSCSECPGINMYIV